MKVDLDELSARFEIAFRVLESDNENFSTVDKLKQIDVFADYLYERSDNDYIDGNINENSEVFMFIDNMITNSKDCRQIIIKELEDREEFEFLKLLTTPVSETTEQVIDELGVFN